MLTIITGPVESGKTSKLLYLFNKYEGKKNIFSYGDPEKKIISSRDGSFYNNAIYTYNLNIIEKGLNYNKGIFIDEVQFFDSLDIFINKIITNNDNYNDIYISGLYSDCKKKKFGKILDLFPISDEIILLTSECKICNKLAMFSDVVKNFDYSDIRLKSNYIPKCNLHYGK